MNTPVNHRARYCVTGDCSVTIPCRQTSPLYGRASNDSVIVGMASSTDSLRTVLSTDMALNWHAPRHDTRDHYNLGDVTSYNHRNKSAAELSALQRIAASMKDDAGELYSLENIVASWEDRITELIGKSESNENIATETSIEGIGGEGMHFEGDVDNIGKGNNGDRLAVEKKMFECMAGDSGGCPPADYVRVYTASQDAGSCGDFSTVSPT